MSSSDSKIDPQKEIKKFQQRYHKLIPLLDFDFVHAQWVPNGYDYVITLGRLIVPEGMNFYNWQKGDDLFKAPQSQVSAFSYDHEISIWNTKNSFMPLKELTYEFTGRPVGDMFYISKNNRFVYFFLRNKDFTNNIQIKKMVVLDLKTLQVMKDFEIELPSGITDSHILNAQLINEGKSLLLETGKTNCYYIDEAVGGFYFIQNGSQVLNFKRDQLLQFNNTQVTIYTIFAIENKQDPHFILIMRDSRQPLQLYLAQTKSLEDLKQQFETHQLTLLNTITVNAKSDESTFIFPTVEFQHLIFMNVSDRHIDAIYDIKQNIVIPNEQASSLVIELIQQNKIRQQYFNNNFHLNNLVKLMYSNLSEMQVFDLWFNKDNSLISLTKGSQNYSEINYTENKNEDIPLKTIKELSDINISYELAYQIKGKKEIIIQPINKHNNKVIYRYTEEGTSFLQQVESFKCVQFFVKKNNELFIQQIRQPFFGVEGDQIKDISIQKFAQCLDEKLIKIVQKGDMQPSFIFQLETKLVRINPTKPDPLIFLNVSSKVPIKSQGYEYIFFWYQDKQENVVKVINNSANQLEVYKVTKNCEVYDLVFQDDCLFICEFDSEELCIRLIKMEQILGQISSGEFQEPNIKRDLSYRKYTTHNLFTKSSLFPSIYFDSLAHDFKINNPEYYFMSNVLGDGFVYVQKRFEKSWEYDQQNNFMVLRQKFENDEQENNYPESNDQSSNKGNHIFDQLDSVENSIVPLIDGQNNNSKTNQDLIFLQTERGSFKYINDYKRDNRKFLKVFPNVDSKHVFVSRYIADSLTYIDNDRILMRRRNHNTYYCANSNGDMINQVQFFDQQSHLIPLDEISNLNLDHIHLKSKSLLMKSYNRNDNDSSIKFKVFKSIDNEQTGNLEFHEVVSEQISINQISNIDHDRNRGNMSSLVLAHNVLRINPSGDLNYLTYFQDLVDPMKIHFKVFQSVSNKVRLNNDSVNNEINNFAIDTQNINKFCYKMCGNYIFFSRQPEILYFEFSSKAQSIEHNKISVKLDNFYLQDVWETCQDHVIQFVLLDIEREKQYLILNWNMLRNAEESSFEITGDIMKANGVQQKYNYYIKNDGIQDVHFQSPILQFANHGIIDPKRIEREGKGEEAVINYDFNQIILKVNNKVRIQLDCSLEDIILYAQFLDCVNMHIITDPSQIPLSLFQCRIDTNSIFHHFATDAKMLRLFQTKCEQQSNTKLLLNILVPNKYGQSPFDIAMQSKNEQAIEIMIQMLEPLNGQYRTSFFIQKYIKELLSLNLPVFEKYLEDQFFQLKQWSQPLNLKWILKEDEKIMGWHTSIFDQDFFDELLENNKKKTDRSGIIRKEGFYKTSRNINKNEIFPSQYGGNLESSAKAAQPDQFQLFDISNQGKETDEIEAFKQVNIKLLNFDWIFQGQFAKEFMRSLANTDNDNWFTITPIVMMINLLWDQFFYKILLSVFIPYVSHMVIFHVYVIHLAEQRFKNTDDDYWYKLNLAFSIISLIFLAYLVSIEIIQIIQSRVHYFLSFWNWIDFLALVLNIAYVIVNLCEIDLNEIRVIGGAAIFLLWLKFFYFLKLFQPTAAMIRMIIQVCLDMYTFSAILTLAIWGFGNTFYILSLALIPADGEEEITVPDGSLYRFYYFITILYSFKTGLGDFDTDGFTQVYSNPFIWIIWLLCVIIIQIVLLNLLIAIMSDTYARVMSVSDQSKLHEIASMISDYEYLVDRSKVFSKSKYLVWAKLEKSDNNSNQSWEGKVNALKTAFQNSLKETTESINEKIGNVENKFDRNMAKLIESQMGLNKRFEELREDLQRKR